MFRENCLICQSRDLSKIIDLGCQPFADSFIQESRRSDYEKVYPLICDLCLRCGQIQTSCETDPQDRYAFQDYSYTSSNSSFSRNHWDSYAETVSNWAKLKQNSFIVEIGSNDGYLSEQFMKKGYKVLGVDPSPYMAELARKRNIDTEVNVFDTEIASAILTKYGKSQLIVANNVFNHSDRPLDFTKAVSKLLDSKGTYIFELPYWISCLQSKKFDQIYHEHVNYFSVTSSEKILETSNLKIVNVELVDYHGGSIRVYAKHKDNEMVVSDKVHTMIEEEKACGAFELSTYERFMKHIQNQRNKFMRKIYELKSNGESIIGVGAAAKGNTFLNYYNLDNSILDYVTDSSPHKKGKYTPLTRIPICGDEIFSKYDKVNALILSWNISHKLKDILLNINPNINFLTLPE